MRFIFAALSLVCLLVVFVTDSPGLLGLCLFGTVIFAFFAVLGFAQAKIEATRQREAYVPSPEERELIRRAAEKRRQQAGGTAMASGPATSRADADDGAGDSD